MYVLVMVASKLLLVSCRVEEGHVSSLLELVDCIFPCLLVGLLVICLELGDPYSRYVGKTALEP